HIDGVRRGDHEQRVAVGGSARDRLQCEIAAGARPVVDDHRLAEPLRQRLADQARDDVGRAAGGDGTVKGTARAREGLAPAVRGTPDTAAAPAARCKNLRRGSFKLSLPSHHSITSSARTSSVCGTVMSSARAVLKLAASHILYQSAE